MRISIKRRLIISNILIFVIPIISAFIMFAIISVLVLGRFDGFISHPSELTLIPILHESSSATPERNILIEQTNVGQYVLHMSESISQHFGNLIEHDGAYITISVASYLEARADERMADTIYLIFLAIFLALLLLAMLINRIFTKFVFKPIMTSMGVLADGVQEIGGGNLKHKIEQDMGNEFDLICANFNEMADRLHGMVAQRQADEKNRRELIAGISHDLRTPLTSIKTYVEGIELGMASAPEKQSKYLSTIKSKANDIEHIINQLFLFSRLDIGEFPMVLEQKDAGHWVANFASNVKDEYAIKNLDIILEENIQGVFFSVDSTQLKNVFINILENSVKYGNKNNGMISIACTKNSKNITINLTDNGSGVPSDSLDMLFDIFYRTDKARSNLNQGSGLGLAISAKMIEKMGGTIRATNVVDGGLCVTLNFPIVQEGIRDEKDINN